VLSGKHIFLAAGVVIDPKVLIEELDNLLKYKIDPKLTISPSAHVILPYHRVEDGAQEIIKGGQFSAGTTKRGIGPCYSDKAARFGVRIEDFMDDAKFKKKLEMIDSIKRKSLGNLIPADMTADSVFKEYVGYAHRLKKYIGSVTMTVNDGLMEGKNVLFEGAQGAMLDIDHGLYPRGTSSSCISGGACTGVGVGPTRIDEVVGVVKAYTSRVGDGPVPTEIFGDEAKKLQEKGGEYGTTTGRTRRVGWLDAVNLRYTSALNGVTGFAITKLDILCMFPKIKICTAYDVDGKRVTVHPLYYPEFEKAKPIYEEMPSWKECTNAEWREIIPQGFAAFPKNCKRYVKRVSEICNAKPYMISVGPAREDTLILKDVFAKGKKR